MIDGAAGVPSALEMRGIHKRFGDTIALDGADFVARPGTIHALLGENGAGKSTLMRIAYGLTRPDAGTTVLLGSARIGSVRDAIAAGAGMVHQHLSLVPALTAAENLALGGAGRFHPREAADALERASSAFGLPVPRDALARDLGIVEQQRLEILKALSHGARLLILDEPTAVLAPAEATELLRWLRSFAAQGGTAVLVTHKLREALDSADDITVLRRGRVALTARAQDIGADDLAAAIFPDGTAPTGDGAAAPAARGAVVVRASGMDVADARGAARIRGASFEIHAGDIVGVAAVEGSGHQFLLRALAGLLSVTGGELQAPSDVALIPADRLHDALIPAFSLGENVALHGAGGRRGLIRWTDVAARTRAIIERFGIVASSETAAAASLSGGNQQRLVVGRELELPKRLIVADNPARGLDLRATAFVHAQLRAAAADGAAVILHASDLDDILAIATRMLVVFHGNVREVGLEREAIGRAMLGAS